MESKDLQSSIISRPDRFAQPEALRGGSEDGSEVVVVGLVVGIGWLAVLFGGVGVNDTRIEAGLAKGTLHGPVVIAGAFDGDDHVTQFMLSHGLAKQLDGGLEIALGVRQRSWWQQHLAVEVR